MVALWNSKARMWVNGRKDWKQKLNNWQSAVSQGQLLTDSDAKPNNLKTIWMHCASLGEFEQGRPLLEAIRTQYPGYKIILTFFSPSGYEIRKNYEGADLVMYLPMDGPANARAFIEAINPTLVLWVKYEYWFYYLKELKNKNIPVLLISGIFRRSQPFFRWYGGFWKKILGSFQHLFVQTDYSIELLSGLGIVDNATVTGDTRFDRVAAIASQWETLGTGIDNFCEGHTVLVAGSTWEEDEALLTHYVKAYPNIHFIIAPHDIDKQRITDLQHEFPTATLYSSLLNNNLNSRPDANVIIIDNIGTLSRLYKYATITYVGGGFNKSGIHNILEAAVYGKPVIFGPVYEKFAEARKLVDAGGAYSIENALELEALLNNLLNDPALLEESSLIAMKFVNEQKGATAKIMDYIQRNRLLIN